MPLFGKSYKKPPRKKPIRIPGIVRLDGPTRKVGDGRTWAEVLFGTGKKK